MLVNVWAEKVKRKSVRKAGNCLGIDPEAIFSNFVFFYLFLTLLHLLVFFFIRSFIFSHDCYLYSHVLRCVTKSSLALPGVSSRRNVQEFVTSSSGLREHNRNENKLGMVLLG